MASTTIKVPVELRDRLAALAEREDTTLAGAITRSLDAAEEAAFWASVSETLGASYVAGQGRVDVHLESRVSAEALSGDLTDGLDPEESWDDVW